MRRIVYSLIITTLLIPADLLAQDAPVGLSLEDCLEFAVKNQVKMKNAELDRRITISRNREVVGQALPNLKASAGLTYAPLVAAFQVPDFISGAIKGAVQEPYLDTNFARRPVGTLPLAFQPRWTTQPQLELTQLLFEPNVLVALQGRKVLEQMATKNLELTEQDLKVAVTKAYYDVIIAEKRKQLLEQNLVRIGKIEGETREIYKNGLAEKIDVDRITVTLNNLKTEKIRVDQLVSLTYMALKFQMGMELKTPIVLTDSLDEQKLDVDLLMTELDFGKRKEFQLMSLQHDVYSLDLKRQKIGALPTLSAFGNYGYLLYNDSVLFGPGSSWQKSAMVGVKLTVPLFDGFQRHNRVKQAKYTLQQTENDIDNLKLALTLEKESAAIMYRSNIAALTAQRANMQLAEEVYNMAQIKYKEGVGSSLEVVDAESTLKEAQTNYFSALYDAVTSRTNLLKALGQY
jgi:outer membrane protein